LKVLKNSVVSPSATFYSAHRKAQAIVNLSNIEQESA
jgi:hypothetical protein